MLQPALNASSEPTNVSLSNSRRNSLMAGMSYSSAPATDPCATAAQPSNASVRALRLLCCSVRFMNSWPLRAREHGRIDRQPADANAGGREDCVGKRRRSSVRPGLSDTTRSLGARDQVHLDRRHLVDAQQPIVVKIALLHAAALDRDLAVKSRGQAEDDPALQ